jgi:hypothetical protein
VITSEARNQEKPIQEGNLMKYKVYHVKNPTFGIKEHPEFNQENYEKVADLELDHSSDTEEGAEMAYNWTQNNTRTWDTNTGVLWSKEGGCRSSAVGDVVVNESGIGYRCEMSDWTNLGQVEVF